MGDSPKKKTIRFNLIQCMAKSGLSCLEMPIQNIQQVQVIYGNEVHQPRIMLLDYFELYSFMVC